MSSAMAQYQGKESRWVVDVRELVYHVLLVWSRCGGDVAGHIMDGLDHSSVANGFDVIVVHAIFAMAFVMYFGLAAALCVLEDVLSDI